MQPLTPCTQRTRHERKRTARIASVIVAVMFYVSPLFGLPISFRQDNVPDFGQFAKPEWGNCSCGPAAAATQIWWLSNQGYADLRQGGSWGNDSDAHHIIEDLALTMHSSPLIGTTYSNMESGLREYLDSYYPGQFEVQLVRGNELGGVNFWEFLKQEASSQAAVVPLVVWPNGYGHAISMVSYHDDPYITGDEYLGMNDPATNGTTHHWSGEYLEVKINGYNTEGISLARWSSGTGYIGAAVVAHVIGEPTSGSLLVIAAISVLRTARRRLRVSFPR